MFVAQKREAYDLQDAYSSVPIHTKGALASSNSFACMCLNLHTQHIS